MTAAQSHDTYLAACDAGQRALLQDLRERLRAMLPSAEEVISYQMPGFRIGKKVVAGYAAFTNHCSFFPHSGDIVPAFEAEIRGLGMTFTKSGLHFTVEKPIPEDLLKRMVAARLVEAGVSA